jgi:hypothetical protein
MARRGGRTAQIMLDDAERETLERWARRARRSQALALRCRNGLMAGRRASRSLASGSPVTIGLRRTRVPAKRLDGLNDEPSVARWKLRRPRDRVDPRLLHDEPLNRVVGVLRWLTVDRDASRKSLVVFGRGCRRPGSVQNQGTHKLPQGGDRWRQTAT